MDRRIRRALALGGGLVAMCAATALALAEPRVPAVTMTPGTGGVQEWSVSL